MPKVIINISEELYSELKTQEQFLRNCSNKYKVMILDGNLLPKQHGRLKDVDAILKAMIERDEDNGGEPLNAVDRGYHLAIMHLKEEIEQAKTLVDANKELGNGKLSRR